MYQPLMLLMGLPKIPLAEAGETLPSGLPVIFRGLQTIAEVISLSFVA